MRLAMMSFADINNYGDILFSHIFDMEIKKRLPEAKIDFYSPTTIDLEGYHYEGYIRDKVENKYDGVFLVGGEVIHLFDERTWQPIYSKQNKKIESRNASDVVWDWVDASSFFKVWLSVGVRPFGDKWDEEKINSTLNSLNYISCRGILSKKILEGSNYESFNKKIKVTPDLGWIFPQYLDYVEQRGSKYSKYIPPKDNYLLFQVHNINDDEAERIATELLRYKENKGYQIVLMPVIHLWSDETYLEKINEFSNNEFITLPNDLSVIEMLDIIVHASATVTSSLHVAITALAADIPAGILNKWQGSKLQDLYGLQFRTEALIDDIDELPMLLTKLDKEEGSKALKLYSSFMREKLSEVFDEVTTELINSKNV